MAVTKRRGVVDAASQRLNVRINPESYKRLMVHCVMAGMTPGRLVEQLISEHLRDWRVQSVRGDRIGSVASSVSVPSSPEIKVAESTAA